jgi:uncharacterized protein (DUF433 family)
MTIKWVKVDPLVMRGEPFLYNTRLTVRQLLELRRNGYGVARLLTENPELQVVGIAQAYRYAAENRERYSEFFGPPDDFGPPRELTHRRRGAPSLPALGMTRAGQQTTPQSRPSASADSTIPTNLVGYRSP